MVLMGYAGSTLTTPGALACLSDSDITTALARFKYDARNRRVARQQNSQWTYVVSDSSGNPLSEFVRTGDAAAPWAKVRDYVWLDGRFLAQVEYTGIGGSGPSYVYYAHLDHLGQPRALTNAGGQIVWSTFQRPYGEVLEKTTTDPLSGMTVVTNLRLPGQYDERLFQQAGLNMQGPYYNWNRWYLPSVGRYMEPDPIAKGGGFNGDVGPGWYGYAEGNPLKYVDTDSSQSVPAYPFVAPPPLPPAANMPMITPALPWFARVLGALPALVWPSMMGEHRGDTNPVNGDPPWKDQLYSKKTSVNPGRRPGGGCNPCPPDSPFWTHNNHTCEGTHQHYMFYRQNPVTCECWVDRFSPDGPH
jgi:RHS repeat-associated protein